MTIPGTYYAPGSSCAIDVTVQAEGAALRLTAAGLERQENLDDCPLSEPLGRMARHFTLPDGARVEITDIDALAAWEKSHRRSSGMHLVHGLESRWRWVAAAALFLIGLMTAGYLWGLPMAAKHIALRLPPKISQLATEQAMGAFETLFDFEASKLSQERRDTIAAQFAKMAAAMDPGSQRQYRLRFFHAPFPNAFALPDGLVCITDELIEKAKHDNEVFGVLAHEIVHVREQHGLRNVLQDSAVFLLWTLMTGDISTVAGMGAALPAMLAQSGYSRGFEREADLGAADYMIRAGWGVKPLCDMLQRIDPEGFDLGKTGEALSTHPLTGERVKALEAHEAAHDRQP
jgi:Zn-dependent protease with chaperone function